MGRTDLQEDEAVSKLKSLAESMDFAMMMTNLGHLPFHVVPMTTKKVDKEGNIWFLSGRQSNHNRNIEADDRVHLIYSKPSSMEFLTVYGKAIIEDDPRILKELYGSTDDMWFEGVKDPNLTAIKVIPLDADYWETKGNQLIALFKMGVGAMTGSRPDITEQGELKIGMSNR